MSDTATPSSSSRSASMEDLAKGISGDAGTPQGVTVPDHPRDPDGFPSWPTRLGAKLPEEFLDRIKKARAEALPAYTFKVVSSKTGGYTYGGVGSKMEPKEKATPEEAKDPKRNAVVLRVYDDMHQEGGVSAVMTGDAAIFTWGRGISSKSPSLSVAFRDFIRKAPGAEKALLEHGITIVGSANADWRIVDVDSGMVLSGNAAIDFLNGSEPADRKKEMLASIAKVTEAFLQQATDSQWYAFKKFFMYDGDHKVPDDVIQTWKPETVAYVVHAGAYGNFLKAWPEYSQTHGDLAKILRIAAMRNQHTKVGSHILVPKKTGSGAAPSTTLLFGMGKEMMVTQGIVKRLDGYPGSAQADDVVFEIVESRQKAGTGSHMVLRAAAVAESDPQTPFDFEKWVDSHYVLSMEDLLAACEKLGYERLRLTRDWYSREVAAPGGKKVPAEKWGPRPRLAMDAVLHKGEGENGRWILEAAIRDKLCPPNYADQYYLLQAKIGIA